MPIHTRSNTRNAEHQRIAQVEKETLQEKKRQQKRFAERKDCLQCRVNAARSGCNLCVQCHRADGGDKEGALVICQGCPSMIPTKTHDMIRWKQGDQQMVEWLERYLEIEEGPRSSNTAARWLQVTGWKGESGTQHVPRMLDRIHFLVSRADFSGLHGGLGAL